MDCLSYKNHPALPGVCGLGAGAPLILPYKTTRHFGLGISFAEVFSSI